jgi:hypothetical protein
VQLFRGKFPLMILNRTSDRYVLFGETGAALSPFVQLRRGRGTGIAKVLSHDEQYEQAGVRALLRDDPP